MLAGCEADRARMAELQAQISDLSALRSEKASVQQRLDSYRYPVLTLPNEIVSEIFIHFLPIYPSCPPLTGILSPNILTQICREWRETALATPALWRAISVSDNDLAFQQQIQSRTDLWLSRSGCCPLSIRIDDYDSLMPFGTEVIAALVPHRARWEHLDLRLRLSSRHLRAIIDGPMPLLRSLRLSTALDSIHRSDPPDLIELPELPLLCEVSFNDDAAAYVVPPWAQIISLDLEKVFPHECFPILRQTSNLIQCELELFSWDDNAQLPDIGLPSLKSLTVTNPGADPATGYMTTLIFPALRTLQIPEQCLQQNPIGSLISFISKSGCELQKKISFKGPYVGEMDDEEDSEV
ncbi:hypothetical protein B0H13DRAFT_2111270 [Mycena leptocephala]|nr:hypothetical protein B0H13DRAFT_2111270 [Mycena leptocephala]